MFFFFRFADTSCSHLRVASYFFFFLSYIPSLYIIFFRPKTKHRPLTFFTFTVRFRIHNESDTAPSGHKQYRRDRTHCCDYVQYINIYIIIIIPSISEFSWWARGRPMIDDRSESQEKKGEKKSGRRQLYHWYLHRKRRLLRRPSYVIFFFFFILFKTNLSRAFT